MFRDATTGTGGVLVSCRETMMRLKILTGSKERFVHNSKLSHAVVSPFKEAENVVGIAIGTTSMSWIIG